MTSSLGFEFVLRVSHCLALLYSYINLFYFSGSVRLGVAPIGTKNSSTPKEFHQDSTYPPPLLNDLSVIEPRSE